MSAPHLLPLYDLTDADLHMSITEDHIDIDKLGGKGINRHFRIFRPQGAPVGACRDLRQPPSLKSGAASQDDIELDRSHDKGVKYVASAKNFSNLEFLLVIIVVYLE